MKQNRINSGRRSFLKASYQGKPADAWGGCPIFPGKQVAGKGWCSAYVKKA